MVMGLGTLVIYDKELNDLFVTNGPPTIKIPVSGKILRKAISQEMVVNTPPHDSTKPFSPITEEVSSSQDENESSESKEKQEEP